MFDEKEIVKRIVKDDFRAFELLVKQYEKLVFYVVHRLVQGQHNKEDICQDVFIKVYQNIGKFQFQSKLSTWIARIAYLTAVDYTRKSKKDFFSEYPDDIDRYHFTDENPEEELIQKDAAAYINSIIEQMPIQYQTVITLYHLNEFSCAEIQDITGIPEGTVKSYLFRARKLMKEKMQKVINKNGYERNE